MKSIRVKDLMVPISEYATVSKEATLYEAIVVLREAQRKLDSDRERLWALLVFEEENRIVGKLDLWDVVRGVERKYGEFAFPGEVVVQGVRRELLSSMLKTYGLWEEPLDDICLKAADIRVNDIMHQPEETEYVEEDATLDKAANQLVMGHHQSLIVTREENVVGIVRLSDVFGLICERIKTCRI